MKHKTRLLPLAGLLLAGGILCTGCGGAAPASSAPAAVSTASSVEEVSAMDGYDYLNDYIGLWGYYDIDLWLRVHEDSTFEFVNSEDETIYTGTADADITGSQAEGFFRGLHQDGNGPRKPDQHNEQHSRDQREYNNRATDDLPDVLRPLFAQIPGDEHGDAHCKLCYHEGDKVQHLAAGGHGRKARG